MPNSKISIMTPTFNRGYIIHQLFESLQKQIYKNFEWIVIDDGSTDNTEKIINNFKKISDFDIVYHKQTNMGKHIAINNGITNASGKIFTIVDSDDYVLPKYTQSIIHYFQSIKHDPSIAGIGFPRGGKNGTSLAKNFIEDKLICTFFDINYKYHVSGEIDYALKMDILRHYSFPKFKGEKFCPESLLWRRIAAKYKTFYINQTIQIGEYLEDGLTAKYWEIVKRSPKSAMLVYSELSRYKQIPRETKKFALEIYWKFALADTSISFFNKFKPVPFFLSVYTLFNMKIKSYIK